MRIRSKYQDLVNVSKSDQKIDKCFVFFVCYKACFCFNLLKGLTFWNNSQFQLRRWNESSQLWLQFLWRENYAVSSCFGQNLQIFWHQVMRQNCERTFLLAKQCKNTKSFKPTIIFLEIKEYICMAFEILKWKFFNFVFEMQNTRAITFLVSK